VWAKPTSVPDRLEVLTTNVRL